MSATAATPPPARIHLAPVRIPPAQNPPRSPAHHRYAGHRRSPTPTPRRTSSVLLGVQVTRPPSVKPVQPNKVGWTPPAAVTITLGTGLRRRPSKPTAASAATWLRQAARSRTACRRTPLARSYAFGRTSYPLPPLLERRGTQRHNDCCLLAQAEAPGKEVVSFPSPLRGGSGYEVMPKA